MSMRHMVDTLHAPILCPMGCIVAPQLILSHNTTKDGDTLYLT